jgi:hypothetical protein
MVERWFAETTNKRIRRGSWNSVNELVEAIQAYIKAWNKHGKPLAWKKSANDIMDSINKAKSA